MKKLIPIENQNQRVLLTSQLAEEYETTSKIISNNFNNNRDHYIEGKHYYRLEGKALADFLQSSNLGLQNQDKIRSLYLWTENGALLHAKSLNTDKAWKVYEELVDTYFKVQPVLKTYQPKATSLGEVASFLKIMRSIMKENGQLPVKIAEMAETVCKQFNIKIPEGFVRRNPFQQTSLFNITANIILPSHTESKPAKGR